MTRVLLLRHGQSVWNAEGRWQGQADPPLSALGRRQARAAADHLGVVDAIASSDLERAAGTAAIIAETIGVGPVVLEPGLRERDAGEFSGLTRAEIEEAFPGYLEQRRRPPSWEPDEVLLDRVTDALLRIAALAPGGDVLAVTHGGVVYTLEAHLGHDGSGYLPNVAGRWIGVDIERSRLSLGDRIVLVEVDDPMATAPRVL